MVGHSLPPPPPPQRALSIWVEHLEGSAMTAGGRLFLCTLEIVTRSTFDNLKGKQYVYSGLKQIYT